MNLNRKLLVSLFLAAFAMLAGREAFAHHAAVLPQREYQKQFPSLPMNESVFVSTPAEAPYKVNEFLCFATTVDMLANNGETVDVIFYAQDAKSIPLDKPARIRLTAPDGAVIFDADVAPDSFNSFRLRFLVREPSEYDAEMSFTDGGYKYKAFFKVQAGSPGIDPIATGACCFACFAALAAAARKKR